MSKENQEPASLKVLFVGDVMLGRVMKEVLKEKAPASAWGETLSLLQTADVRICNLESVLSEGGTAWSTTAKQFPVRSEAKQVAMLKAAQIDAASLANNQVLDFDYEALSDLMNALEEAGIHYAGAGMDLREASEPAIWKVKGQTIGLLAFTENEPEWEATEEQPRVWYVPIKVKEKRAQRLFETVRRTKSEVDLLVVSAHWGPNGGSFPSVEHGPFAHSLIDEGADVIFGHSGHAVRGLELYKGRPILYCTGDCIDDDAVESVEQNDGSWMVLMEIAGSRVAHLLLMSYPEF